ncbi:MAG: OsmC family protein [Fimbriimonadaceae bacterium]|nr:OsmC family protein [Fimbriimonadaceae bacterium]
MANETTVRVVETGASPFAVAITVGKFNLIGDEPPELDGANLGPAPYDFLTIALAECTAMTIRWYARQQGWPLDRVQVTVTHAKRDRIDTFRKRIEIEGPLLSAEQRAKLREVADKCPVHRTLLGTPEFSTEADDA